MSSPARLEQQIHFIVAIDGPEEVVRLILPAPDKNAVQSTGRLTVDS